uniref:Enoyl reductase (ER) domain-containing protein n=1 Tax=Cuerna arida TaxID=1464854 RepID=A0A1B6GN60_9HEMI
MLQIKCLQKAKEDLKQNKGKTHLLIGEYEILSHLAASLQDVRSTFYLSFLTPGKRLDETIFQPILTHQMINGTLILMKKLIDPKTLKVVEFEGMPDLRHLMSQETTCNATTQNVALVIRNWQPSKALETLAQEPFADKLRCVFLDHQAPRFSVSSPLYHEQLSLDLTVNVLSRNIWGSYKNISLPDILADSDHLRVLESSYKGLDIECISLNTQYFTLQPDTLNKKIEVSFLDYCGTRSSGKRVMGIAKYDSEIDKIVPDKILTWNVPSEWSAEDATTVPFTYCLAYYSLLLQANLEKGEKILVHAGTSPVGLAAISIALARGSNLYVTVCSDLEVPFLLSLFPQINYSQVIVLEKTNFELEVKRLTQNTGVNVVVNCLKGKDMNASLRLLGNFSRLIHLSDSSVEDREALYTFPFLRLNHMYGVSLDNVINADVETKRKLKTLVQEGIKNSVVKPLKHSTYTVQQTTEALNNLRMKNAVEKTVVVRPQSYPTDSGAFHCDPNEIFIVVGTRQGLWLDLAEWLLKNGAKKLVIASLKQNLTTNISRRFNSMLALHRATVLITTIARMDTHKEVVDFLQEAIKMGPVAGIFFSCMDEKSSVVAHLDSVSRQLLPQLKHFVCLFGGSASVCELRAQNNLPACLIQAESELKPQSVLPYLGRILGHGKSMGYSLILSHGETDYKQKDQTVSVLDVKNHLPTSLSQLAALGQRMSSEEHGKMQEVITRSPLYQHVRYQLLPIFLVPGLDSDRLTPLIKQLMHPAFCPPTPPCLPSVEQSAQLLLQEILRVRSSGPYNLLGDSWSGTVVLQLATFLQHHGLVEVFLLDAAPDTAKQRSTAFSNSSDTFRDSEFLITLLGLPTNISKHLSEMSSWEEQVQYSLSQVQMEVPNDCRRTSLKYVTKALTMLRNHLKALTTFQPSELFEGNVHLLRTREALESDFCGLKKYCKKTPTIHIIEDETLEEMIKNPKTTSVINENMIFAWNL